MPTYQLGPDVRLSRAPRAPTLLARAVSFVTSHVADKKNTIPALSNDRRRALRRCTIALAAGAFALVLPCRRARAALGGDAASIAADSVEMNGAWAAKSASQYAVHEIRTSSGIVVREYVGHDAKVFAVTWSGPFMPNMRQLLGAYFEPYSRAVRNRHTRRRPFIVDEPDLVVRSSGHMRSFFGEAHIPAALPEGVRAEELQ